MEITSNEVWIYSEEVCYGLDFSFFDDIATQIHCDDAAGCGGPRRNSAKMYSSTEKAHLCEQGYIVICQSLGHLVIQTLIRVLTGAGI